jgi:hypothetical protein
VPYIKNPKLTPDWVKVSDVAVMLDCGPKAVLDWVRKGTLQVRAVRFENTTRINRADLDRELEKRARIGLNA